MKKIMLFSLMMFAVWQTSAQTTKKSTAQAIKEKDFVFIPTRVTPFLDNPTNLIGSLYFMSIKPDTITTYLPGFGVSDGPGQLKFLHRTEYESIKFTYKNVQAKNGSWNISIDFLDSPGAVRVRMLLWINKNGYGTLTVNKTSQKTKVFHGYLKSPDQASLAD